MELAARAASAAAPHHPVDAEEMALFWRWSDSLGTSRRWVALTQGDPLGWSAVSREGDETHAWVEVDLPGADVETYAAAYGFGEERARELGAGEAAARVWEDRVPALEALRARGWRQRRRERFWRLELQPAVARLERELRSARSDAPGLAVARASDLGGTELYPALYELYRETQPDIPSSTVFVAEPIELWTEWMSPPRVRPERVWVGLADGRPVGYSYLAYRPVGIVETGYTCVLRDFRGRGLARLMKLETLVQAAALGVEAVETDNDSENAPIIHLNQALGYTEITGSLEFAKPL